ncbi:hypothetical protein [Dolichospermum compactum]|uniref:Uncharacterized protein n=1 Tax=Dolichospermum compactum NIES-806 TaxID=1973481 RepID=A0A1Z4V2H3_9CYAN|nr:hypothetical protein [Dolichospermum compactum]BAZ85731.1 hypothetical protein NIES806_19350 [Dolichospermum compactum NIES-806]
MANATLRYQEKEERRKKKEERRRKFPVPSEKVTFTTFFSICHHLKLMSSSPNDYAVQLKEKARYISVSSNSPWNYCAVFPPFIEILYIKILYSISEIYKLRLYYFYIFFVILYSTEQLFHTKPV